MKVDHNCVISTFLVDGDPLNPIDTNIYAQITYAEWDKKPPGRNWLKMSWAGRHHLYGRLCTRHFIKHEQLMEKELEERSGPNDYVE